jgi:hypothetical protein
MTNLSKRKSKLVFFTDDAVRESGKLREVTVTAHPYHADIRLKGMKTSYSISWASVYSLAVKQAVEQARRDKKARTK